LVLDDLTDVSVPSPAEGEVLTWSGTEWEAEAPVVPSLDDLTDVSAPSPTEGEVLTWSGTEWEAEPVPAASLDLDDLTDVSAPAPAEGEVLTWSGTEWAPEALPVLTQVHVIKPSPLSGTSTAGTSLSFGSAAQHNTHFRFTSGTAVTVTVQLDATWSGTQEYWEENYNPSSPQAMPIGGTAIFGKHGAGDITFLPVAGVTIHSPDLLKITKLNGKATLIKAGPNEWDLEGNLATT
jgi:hypothetical protein